MKTLPLRTALSIVVLLLAMLAIATSHPSVREATAQLDGADAQIVVGPGEFPTPYSEVSPTEDRTSESDYAPDADVGAQWITHYYLHPFLPTCFWYCTQTPFFCPCHVIEF